jgi:hypothetical protein
MLTPPDHIITHTLRPRMQRLVTAQALLVEVLPHLGYDPNTPPTEPRLSPHHFVDIPKSLLVIVSWQLTGAGMMLCVQGDRLAAMTDRR